MAQTNLTVLGGATGADVFCLQAGNPTTGTFVGTFLQTGPGAWEERSKAGTFKFEEKNRDDLMVELFDSSRSASAEIDFVTKTVRQKPSSEAAWSDGYVILNATNQEKSGDCVSFAALSPASRPSSEDADAAGDERSKDSNAKADEPSKRKKDAQSTSKKRKRTAEKPSKRTRARKRKSGSGFSIGIGGGGVGIGF